MLPSLLYYTMPNLYAVYCAMLIHSQVICVYNTMQTVRAKKYTHGSSFVATYIWGYVMKDLTHGLHDYFAAIYSMCVYGAEDWGEPSLHIIAPCPLQRKVIRWVRYSISQEICTRFCCALLCCGYAIIHNEFTSSIYPYSSGLRCWHLGNR